MHLRHKNLFTQLQTYRQEVIHFLEDVTEETAEIIPVGFNNNIRWNLGHIYLDQYLWIETLIKEKTEVPEIFHSWFGFGTSPADFQESTPSLVELRSLLTEQPKRIRETYSHRLEEISPPQQRWACKRLSRY